MITVLKVIGILAILVILTGYLPVVSELPFGMEAALIFFVGTIRGILELMPWLQIVFTLILFAMFIRSMLFAWTWTKWFIELIRG